MNEVQFSRRQALKRGALVGGTLVWTVPVVQAVSLTAAHAESASAPAPRHGAASAVGGSSSGGAPAGAPGSLPFTGAAVPVTGAAVLGAGLLAAGVTATVAASRSHKLNAADGPAEPAPTESTED